MAIDNSPKSSVRREVAHAYVAGVRGLVVCVASAAVGGLVGLLTTRHPLGVIAFGVVGFLIGVVLGVVTAVVRVGISRVRAGMAIFFACGVTGGMFVLFTHHSWVFVVAVLSLPGFAAMGSLPRRSRRSTVVFAAGTAALVGVLLLDVWVGESSEVRQVERRVASAGVDVWAPPMDPGCDIRVESRAWLGYERTGCGAFVDVVLRRDPGAELSAIPQVDVSSRPESGQRALPPVVSAVASMRRGDTVIEVHSTSAGNAPGLVLAVAQGMRRQDAGWLATRDTPLHGWVHDRLR